MQVDLGVPDGVVLLDMAFTGDKKHGFLTGTKQTLLETTDGGKSWEPRVIPSIDEEGINYRFNAIAFNGDEGWLVGKPGVRPAAAAAAAALCMCGMRLPMRTSFDKHRRARHAAYHTVCAFCTVSRCLGCDVQLWLS